MLHADDISGLSTLARRAATDSAQVTVRIELAKYTGDTFTTVGEELHAVADTFVPNRIIVSSPSLHSTDEIAAVSLLFRIGGQLTSACAELFENGKTYAASALVRQVVEVEYLAWAFESRDKDAQRWLKSTADERRTFFTPAKLRQAANGKFRGKDYGYHCELGGHPVPGSLILFRQEPAASQILLSDLLGHTVRIWDHLLDWSGGSAWTLPIHSRREAMFHRYDSWKKADELTLLPPPP